MSDVNGLLRRSVPWFKLDSLLSAAKVSTSASVLAELTGVIDRHITNVESTEMSSFLGELCNVLCN